MKKIYKYLCVSLFSFLIMLNHVFAAGFSTSVTSNSVTVGGSVTLSINGSDIAGKFSISTSLGLTSNALSIISTAVVI